MSEHRTFPLADVLSVTTNKLLSHSHMAGLYELLNYMTGQDLATHQLGTAADACRPALIDQHPAMADLQPSANVVDATDLMAWLIEAERVHGPEVTVQPLACWEYRDPIEDACDQVGAERVYLPDGLMKGEVGDRPVRTTPRPSMEAAVRQMVGLKTRFGEMGAAAQLAARRLPKPGD